VGGSQGGPLSIASAALEPRIARCASAFPFLSDYRRVWAMDLAEDAYEELRNFFRLFDPRHEREDEIFTRLGYIDVKNLAPRIEAKVFMGLSLMDPVCPPSTPFAVCNAVRGEKERLTYPGFAHEALPGFYDRAFDFLAAL
jgi:cephalosporin-C deacetylase